MPDIENTDLGWLIQFLGRVNTLGKRGMRAALASQPRCRLGMLEHLHFQIEQSGHDGSIYVSELARATRQPMPAVSRGLRLLEQDGHILRETDPNDRRKTLVRITPEGEQARLAGEQAINGYFSRVMARLTPEELAQMVALKDAFLAAIVAENDALEQDLANRKGDPAHDQNI